MKGINKIKKKLRNLKPVHMVVSLAILLAVLSMAGTIYKSYAAGFTTIQLKWNNLLKDNDGFEFYGKSNRTGLWAYDAVIDGETTPVLCLEPAKRMSNGTIASVETIAINDQNFPYKVTNDLTITLEQAEALYYVLGQGHMVEGYLTETGLNSPAMRVVVQSAVWAIMSGQWDGIDNFVESLDPIIDNLKDASMAASIRNYADFLLTAQEYTEQNTIPAFAKRYKVDAENSVGNKMSIVDGVYQTTLPLDNSMWPQTQLIWNVPDGWEYSYSEDKNEITFKCMNGNPEETIQGTFAPGSGGSLYWYQPSELTVLVTGSLTYQVMLAAGGEKVQWEVFAKFTGDRVPTIPGTGGFAIDVKRYEHEERFVSDYNIELNKADAETGQMLEGAYFDILEAFDSSQLSGSLLDENLLSLWNGWKVCWNERTNSKGYLDHSDERQYDYCKRYCGGHPDPVIEYIEYDGDDEDEQDYIDELNAELERQAWEAWQAEINLCEELMASGELHFHSITEGEAERQLEEDRDATYEEFINLEYIYTVREVAARTGYIQHGLHNDDDLVEIVAIKSSQAGAGSRIIGYHSGSADSEPDLKSLNVSKSERSEQSEATQKKSEVRPIDQSEVEEVIGGRFVVNGDDMYQVDEEGNRLSE